jgi:asparagine synthase (glutamine-hydrolysing)
MSAICGIVNLDGGPVEAELLRGMAVASAVRGPDGVGEHIAGGAGFVHLAFHVTPESVHERQPLTGDQGRLVLVADVRLDNRDELIRRLMTRQGPNGEITTDADLLLLAYRAWGERCVEHLLGDFVFAIWDDAARALFLARDPLGAYSLSYHQSGQRFIFASETAAILDLPGFKPVIKELTVTRVLAGLPPTAEDTFSESVFYLPPAHCLTVRPQGIRQWRYWTLAPRARIQYRDDAQYVDHFLELLDQAIACRLRSIGPVGISLSGGNDSTLLAARAACLLPGANPAHPRLRSFSYVFDRHPACDERAYIEPVVAQHGLDAAYIPSDDAWTFHYLAEQPIAGDFLWTDCYVELPRRVARAAQDAGCRVLIDGHFGDTLCSGHSYYAADLLSRGHWRRLLVLLGTERNTADRWRSLIHHGLRLLLPEWLRHAYREFKPLPIKPFVAGLAPHRLERLTATQPGGRYPSRCQGLSPGRRPRCRSLLNPSWPTGMAAVRGFLYARHRLEKTSPYFDRR